MVHSFNLVRSNNGNISVVFYQDNKKRQIIFQKDTEAQRVFLACVSIAEELEDTVTINLQDIIKSMREDYIFKANANNPSIFRPIHKSLILKNS